MAKVGGGVNPMHMSNDKHPFQKKFGAHTGAGKATSQAAHPSAAGVQGKFRSANAAMKGK